MGKKCVDKKGIKSLYPKSEMEVEAVLLLVEESNWQSAGGSWYREMSGHKLG